LKRLILAFLLAFGCKPTTVEIESTISESNHIESGGGQVRDNEVSGDDSFNYQDTGEEEKSADDRNNNDDTVATPEDETVYDEDETGPEDETVYDEDEVVLEPVNIAPLAIPAVDDEYYPDSNYYLNDEDMGTNWYSMPYYAGKVTSVSLHFAESHYVEYVRIYWHTTYYPYEMDVWTKDINWVSRGVLYPRGWPTDIAVNDWLTSMRFYLARSNGAYFGIQEIEVIGY